MNKIIITQSNYIPWKGYFTTMRKATHLVIYDSMQYTKRDWRNRNRLITPSGPGWLTVPVKVKGKYLQKINETEVSDKDWSLKHWNFIETNYNKSPYFKEYGSIFKDMYMNIPSEMLTDINVFFLKKIVKLLGINIEILDSREFNLKGDRTEKLLNICKDLEADEYFTGPAAKEYIEEKMFTDNNIDVTYYDLNNFKEYKQLWNGFDHHVSIIDMFLNLGPHTIEYFN